MGTLNIDNSSSVSVERGFTPRASGTPPTDFPVPRTPIESEPVTADVDAHLPLLAEAVGGEAVDTGSDETDCNKKCF